MDPVELERIAATEPRRLDAMLAVRVFGWRKVLIGAYPVHGYDQVGTIRLLPQWTRHWGVDQCITVLRYHGNPAGGRCDLGPVEP